MDRRGVKLGALLVLVCAIMAGLYWGMRRWAEQDGASTAVTPATDEARVLAWLEAHPEAAARILARLDPTVAHTSPDLGAWPRPTDQPPASLEQPPPAYGTRIAILRAEINGQTLEVERPTATVKAGSSLAGSLHLSVDRRGPASSIFPVAGTLSWDRQARVELSRHLRPGSHELTYSLEAKAPQQPGTYFVLVMAGPQYTFHELLGSDHEPAHGGPKGGPYGNGNDVWDWTPEQFDQAWRDEPVDCIWNDKPGAQVLARAVKLVVTP